MFDPKTANAIATVICDHQGELLLWGGLAILILNLMVFPWK